jgi:hypothetical protein
MRYLTVQCFGDRVCAYNTTYAICAPFRLFREQISDPLIRVYCGAKYHGSTDRPSLTQQLAIWLTIWETAD